MPLVPVVAFWSGQRNIDKPELAALLSGRQTDGPYRTIAVSAADAPGLARGIGSPLAPAVRLLSPAEVLDAVRKDAAALGIIRPEDVEPSVRALAVNGFALFGSRRMKDISAWPLSVPSAPPSSFGRERLWTLAAGGDVNLDRSVYVQSILRKKGVDYPWNGGSARIAGFDCCGHAGSSLVVGRRTGDAGSFRNLLAGADLALVNLEGLASSRFVHRAGGYVLSIDPEMLTGLRGAGIDAVSLANNHTLDAGRTAVSETCRELDELGVAHAGGGPSLAAAMHPAWLRAAGLRVALLAFDALEPANWAGGARAGAAPFELGAALAAIRAARSEGADFVIVMVHWGGEYTTYVGPWQRRDAAAMVAAGADVILGAHSHYAGALQTFPRASNGAAPVFYSLGNLLFDFNYDQWTQQGVVAEVTFDGSRAVQLDLRPTIMVDGSQVNLLDPAGDGSALLARIRGISSRYVRW